MNTIVYRNATEINSAMARVFGHMMLAVLTSMVVAGVVGGSADLMAFFFTGFMKWIVVFAPLVAVFFITIALNADPPRPMAVGMLHIFAALMGLSMATIFVVFTSTSIVSAFMGAAVLFGILSAYGYFTKQNLDSLGKFMFVGLIAIVIASIVNIFIGSSVMQMVISALAIIIFLGLTAYDTQKIREELMEERNGCAEVRGALILYLDFINLFLNLLQLFGVKKDD
jgi:FtsH-binding integral membrane protein